MSSECKLRMTVGHPGMPCEGEECVYWRVLGQAGIHQGSGAGCAIQHFQLLDGGEDVAAWLLSVKRRVEGVEFDA